MMQKMGDLIKVLLDETGEAKSTAEAELLKRFLVSYFRSKKIDINMSSICAQFAYDWAFKEYELLNEKNYLVFMHLLKTIRGQTDKLYKLRTFRHYLSHYHKILIDDLKDNKNEEIIPDYFFIKEIWTPSLIPKLDDLTNIFRDDFILYFRTKEARQDLANIYANFALDWASKEYEMGLQNNEPIVVLDIFRDIRNETAKLMKFRTFEHSILAKSKLISFNKEIMTSTFEPPITDYFVTELLWNQELKLKIDDLVEKIQGNIDSTLYALKRIDNKLGALT